MEGLILIRYHKDTTKKALERWEHIDILLESNRRLREAYETIQRINREYSDSLDGYTEYETNAWIKKINEFYIEAKYEWEYRIAIKRFSKLVESIRV